MGKRKPTHSNYIQEILNKITMATDEIEMELDRIWEEREAQDLLA